MASREKLGSIMGVPKKKTSKSRRDMRRSHHKATSANSIVCSKCGVQTRPHTICQKCDTYNK